MRFVAALVASLLATAAASAADLKRVHALSLIGEPKYKADFQQLGYVDLAAPKGGEIKLHSIGGFDSLNPFIIKGDAAPGISIIYENLMTDTPDEMSTEYGLIAESAEIPEDLSFVIFNLRPQARWHDGKPITAEDVVFGFDTVKAKGRPLYRNYYANVAKAEALGPHKVKFSFTGPKNRELPQIVGQLVPVLPKHWWAGRDFEAMSLDVPLGSGPYRIAAVDTNRSIVYERVADWWGKDLPINRGRYNFDRIRYDMYRDATVVLEGFKAHQYDFRAENSARNWATGYDFPGVRDGLVMKAEIPHKRPTGMQGFVFNTRRPIFTDRRVREAIGLAFDFEWSNKNLFYDQYTRTESYFSNSDFAAKGLPEGAELALLEPYRGKVPAEVFEKAFRVPKTDGSGNMRDSLKTAVDLLASAGWTVKDRKLVNREGKHLSFELLLVQADFERVVQPMARNLERLGIEVRIRTVDTAQYINRSRSFDFDMIVGSWAQSDSPGNEQRDFWSSVAADQQGSRNTAGIKDPVVDALIDKIIAAEDRATLVVATRALDRVLLWGHYVIPQFHSSKDRIAYWSKLSKPGTDPLYGPDIYAWWIDPAKDAALKAKEAQGK